MPKMVIVVDVAADPTRTDPHDVAEYIIDTYDENRSHVVEDCPNVEFLSAEWSD